MFRLAENWKQNSKANSIFLMLSPCFCSRSKCLPAHFNAIKLVNVSGASGVEGHQARCIITALHYSSGSRIIRKFSGRDVWKSHTVQLNHRDASWYECKYSLVESTNKQQTHKLTDGTSGIIHDDEDKVKNEPNCKDVNVLCFLFLN